MCNEDCVWTENVTQGYDDLPMLPEHHFNGITSVI